MQTSGVGVSSSIKKCFVPVSSAVFRTDGQSIWPVIDAIGDCEEISLMYARQERVAFDICDGFARAGGKPAVVFTDAGPAAANLMGGIVNSWGDSVPVLFLAGHNERTKIAAKYTKELPFLDVFGPPPVADLVPCDSGMCTATASTATVPNGEAIVALGMTAPDACVATTSGAVFCIGEGEIMAIDSTTLVQVTSLHDVIELAGSADAMCALTRGGEVYCWGNDARGELGRGTHDDGRFVVPALVAIPG
jgi:hypothetical protein